MPEISYFFGIKIFIYYNDHNPPHFHAEYGTQKGIFRIDNLTMIEGNLKARPKSLIVEWGLSHREELIKDWELAKKKAPLKKIKGLD